MMNIKLRFPDGLISLTIFRGLHDEKRKRLIGDPGHARVSFKKNAGDGVRQKPPQRLMTPVLNDVLPQESHGQG
jgi:hypothetical protein